MHIVLKSQICITGVMFTEPYYVPGTLLGTWVISVNKEDKDPCPCIIDILSGKKLISILNEQIREDARSGKCYEKKGGRGNRVRVVGASLTEKVSVNKDS